MALIIQSLTKTHSPQNQLARVSNIYRIHHFIWWLMVYQQRLDPIHAHGDSIQPSREARRCAKEAMRGAFHGSPTLWHSRSF
ncbi:hypothetical protein E1A91_A06G142800v1 [Gossypium mustelinum]|uniref:Uncharacterized protein n=1 Tax=Gossypium mustelinum TaxID=34275 RepID=A0A5D2YXN2_GOSMU|nr:hypothetical protein E1A91_A06G142800v1 [Gossypium mustelinum]